MTLAGVLPVVGEGKMAKKKPDKEVESNVDDDGILDILQNAYSGVDPIWEYEILPIPILGLSRALCGGFRYGISVDLVGPMHVGKSLIAYMALAENQKLGGISILYDSEGPAYNPDLFAAVGGDPSKLKVVPSFTVEKFFDDMVKLCDWAIGQRKKGNPQRIAVVWDSIAGTTTRQLEKEGLSKRDFSKASGISDGAKILGGKLRESRIALICTNQIRDNIGGSEYDIRLHQPGGYAVEHFNSQIIELHFHGFGGSILRLGGQSDGLPIGRKIRGVVVKNRAGPNFREFHFRVWSEDGHPHPEVEGELTKMGIDPREAAWSFFEEDYATFGSTKQKFFTGGGGGYYTWHPDVLKALGKDDTWKYAKFRRKQWNELLTEAPQLMDPTFMAD